MRRAVAKSPRVAVARLFITCLVLTIVPFCIIAEPLERVGTTYGQVWLFIGGGLIACFGLTEIFVKCVWSKYLPSQTKFTEMSTDDVLNRNVESGPLPSPEGGFPSEQRSIDYRKFEKQTAELQAVGYRFVCEGELQSRRSKNFTFTRLFSHPDGSLAMLLQFGTFEGMGHIYCNMLSEFEDGWVWSSSNIPDYPILEMMRLPRFIGRRHSLEKPLSALRTAHVNDRDRLIRELNVQSSKLDPLKYHEWSRNFVKLRRKRFVQYSLWVFILKKLISPEASDCYWGEYKKYARKIAA